MKVKKWYAVNYKNDIGYLASWYCTRNKSQSIDLLGYAGYTILDAKWLDKDVIVLLKHQDKNHYKYLKYNVATTKTVEFYSDDKKKFGTSGMLRISKTINLRYVYPIVYWFLMQIPKG